ncbi:MAG TPA: MMPL family transporter [Actinomycetes bacterium]
MSAPAPPVAPPSPANPAERRPRRPFLWSAVALVVWFALGGLLGPLSGQLSSVQKNDNASFLPASAESTEVNELQAKFAARAELPMFVVFSRDSGITAADRKAIAAFVAELPGIEVGDDKTVADYAVPGPIVPIPSADGKAVLIGVPLDSDKVSQPMSDGKSPILRTVESVRAALPQGSGLEAHVTGPGGLLADLFSVFGSLDTTLLGITALVVALILILVYRSPFLWVIPLMSAGFALTAASGVVYLLAKNDVLTLNGQSQGILTVLVFGAGTDYALLLVARYREELHRYESHFDAMKVAWRGVLEPLVASAATVTVGLLCLLFSELNSNKSTGPVAAIGIVCALLASLTFLPALLVMPSAVAGLLLTGVLFGVLFALGLPGGAAAGLALLLVVGGFVLGVRARRAAAPPRWAFFAGWPAGRWGFWPKVPRHDEHDEKLSGIWSKVAAGVGRHPRRTWVTTTLVLLVAAFFVTTLKADGISQSDAFTKKVDSVLGQQQLGLHFPAGSGSPAIIIGNADQADAIVAAAKTVPGIATIVPYTAQTAGQSTGTAPPATTPKVVDGLVQFQATLTSASDSLAAEQTVQALRTAVHAVPGADAKVGGFTAINYDTQQASRRDRAVIIPIVLAVIFFILALLLRALLAPFLLVLTVVLSFAATLGVCAVVFNHVFHFAGADTSFPLFSFVFLVALGVDYNIFLMTRVREETQLVGTRPGVLKALTVTGGVITSAGLVLAGTFSVLATLPLVFLAELGFAVAFGVLLDTMVVRSLLVPALMYDVDRRIWWPSALARRVS